MASVKKGVTAFWYLEDVALNTSAITGATNVFLSATGTFNFQNVKATRKADRAELKDNTGSVKGEAFTNDRFEGTFKGQPSGDTLAHAITANILPRAGDVVGITDANESYLGTSWIVDEASADGDLSSARSIEIKVHRYADANVTKDAV